MNFSTICRTCLDTDALNPIFVNPEIEKRYLNAIFVTTGLKISPDDGLPQQLCTKCINQLNASLKFRKKCRDSEQMLIKYKDQFETVSSPTSSAKTKGPSLKKTYSKNKKKNVEQEIKYSVLDKNKRISSKNQSVMDESHVVIKYEIKTDTSLIETTDENEEDCDIKEEYKNYEFLEEFDDEDKPLKYLISNNSDSSNNEAPTFQSIENIANDIEEANLALEFETQYTEKIPYEIDITDPKQNRVVCKLCRKSLSIRSIDMHMASAHPGKDSRKVQCDLCYKFVLKDKYNRHMKLMHGVGCEQAEQMKSLLCGYCKAEFDNKEVLIEHVVSCAARKKKRKVCGTGREMVSCDECHKSMQRASLRAHQLVKHKGLGPVCEHCGRRFGNKFRLHEHYRAKHGYDKYRCARCEFQSASAVAMRNHERRHRGEKPFVCEICDAKFHAAYLLTQHKQSHRTERLLKCSECSATFKANNALHMHKMTCHSQSMFQCTMCERTFSCRHYVVKHLRHFHEYRGVVGELARSARHEPPRPPLPPPPPRHEPPAPPPPRHEPPGLADRQT